MEDGMLWTSSRDHLEQSLPEEADDVGGLVNMTEEKLEDKVDTILKNGESESSVKKAPNRWKILVLSNPDGCPYWNDSNEGCNHPDAPVSENKSFRFVCPPDEDQFPEGCPLIGILDINKINWKDYYLDCKGRAKSTKYATHLHFCDIAKKKGAQ